MALFDFSPLMRDFDVADPLILNATASARELEGVEDRSGLRKAIEHLAQKIKTAVLTGFWSFVTVVSYIVAQMMKVMLHLSYVVHKIGAILDTVAVISLKVVPLAIIALLAKLLGRGEAATKYLSRVNNFVENSIRIHSMAWVARQLIFSVASLSLQNNIRTVLLSIPVVGSTIIIAAASIWHKTFNKCINAIGVTLGLIERKEMPIETQKTDNHSANLEKVQFAGAIAAVGVVSTISPATMVGFVWPALVSVAGAQSFEMAYKLCYGEPAISTPDVTGGPIVSPSVVRD